MATPGHRSQTRYDEPRKTRACRLRTSIVRCWRFVLVVVWLATPVAAFEGPPRFERLSLEEGLSQSIVESIVQDETGFMWFATEDGLNRYDGYDFAIYRSQAGNPNSLVGTELKTIHLDAS